VSPPSPEEAVLERVPLLEKHLDDYREVAGDEAIERVRAAAAPLTEARILHVNATAYGGGVAELLATHVPLLRDLGIDADWEVIHGSDEFFGVTKSVHNALQGAPLEWTSAMQRTYLEKVLDNALLLEGTYDYVVIHDPQPAALLALASSSSVNGSNTKWVWRCHIDLTAANPDVWEFFRPYVEQYDASVWTMPEFVPASLTMDRIVQAPPCIDPLSVKNLELPTPFVGEICKQYGIDPNRPMLCQVSRYDPWKDPLGVIEAYRIVREEIPDVQLVLAGSMATDDPEGFQVWQDVDAARQGDTNIHLLSNIQQVGNVQINAFQRAADVVIQKSLREGFGLTVSEGLWKGTPVVGGRAGGIVLQIRDGQDGFLVDSVEDCATRALELLRDPADAEEKGASGREHVRRNFLSTRELEDWVGLFTSLSG
jgi:trehalose synthase